MKTTAEIVVHYVHNPLTGDRVPQVEWVGPAHGIARVTPDILQFAPWPHEILAREDWQWSVYICRTDYPFPWPLACNRIQADADKFARAWRMFQFRLIYTAQVWGFAHVNQGEIPNWGCIGKKPHWR